MRAIIPPRELKWIIFKISMFQFITMHCLQGLCFPSYVLLLIDFRIDGKVKNDPGWTFTQKSQLVIVRLNCNFVNTNFRKLNLFNAKCNLTCHSHELCFIGRRYSVDLRASYNKLWKIAPRSYSAISDIGKQIPHMIHNFMKNGVNVVNIFFVKSVKFPRNKLLKL